MNKLVGFFIVGIFLAPGLTCAAGLTSSQEKLGYSMGHDVGTYFKGLGRDIDYQALLNGIEDAFQGKETILSKEEMAIVQKEFGEKMKAKQEVAMQTMKDENLKAGAEYLEKNKDVEGVVVTNSGLQYQLMEKGDGPTPDASDRVKVDYAGFLIDGTEFDSSIKRGEPTVFGVDQVIPGWAEALQLMEVGSKYRLVIPSELAYGEKGAPPIIQPNSVLVFEVNLLAIEK